ncbi:MAG: hypothetical protein ACRCXZ_07925 [Patescibacteria group bacterium]
MTTKIISISEANTPNPEFQQQIDKLVTVVNAYIREKWCLVNYMPNPSLSFSAPEEFSEACVQRVTDLLKASKEWHAVRAKNTIQIFDAVKYSTAMAQKGSGFKD